MPLNFESGQGVAWYQGSMRFCGIVTECRQSIVEIAPMWGADANTKCFDEGGSKRDTDQYKVRPRGCPPPFSLTYYADFGEYGAYIDADPASRFLANEQLAAEYGMYATDNGKRFPDEVLANTKNPVWRDELEKAKPTGEEPNEPGPSGGMTAARAFAEAQRTPAPEAKPARPSATEKMRRMLADWDMPQAAQKQDDYQPGG